ncbi:probable MFS metabolite transporter [Marinomonas sp. MED121]|uniref:MFS transporter n=1 Tax=Marinomonas sp. MED121 TaxID=314277 RepID=UPI00006905B2|nr:MFS transporter [Marinomonas sp. MED121]EAQ63596.1 probable MFS metabolite transporter [Marinomonas sp. MED121]
MFSVRSRHIAWPLFNFYFFFCAMIGVFMPYMSVYFKSIGFNGTQTGQLLALVTLSTIVAPHFWGWLTNRMGLPKRALQIAVIGACLMALMMNFVSSYSGFWWVMLFYAIFFSALTPLSDTLTLRSIRNLNVPYTRIRVGGSIGFIFAVTLAGYLIESYGPKVILPSVTAFLAIAVLTSFYIFEQPIDTSVKKGKGDFLNLIKDREVIFFLLLAFLSFMAHAPFNVFFAVHLTNAGFSGDQVGLLIAFGVLVEIFVFLFLGNLFTRFNVVYLIAFCFLCGVARWSLIAWYADSVWIALFTQLLHCITFATFHMVSIAQINRLFPEQFAAQGQAMYSGFAIGLGGGVGMVGAGYLWDWFGGQWTFTAASIVSVLALVILILSQKSR